MIKSTALILISLLNILVISSYSQETSGLTCNEILNKANQYFETQRYDTSLFLYQAYLSEQSPLLRPGQQRTDAQVSMQIANILMLKKEYTSAESWYHKALDLADNSDCIKAEIYQNLGSFYLLREHYEYAILFYQKSGLIYSKECNGNPGRLSDLFTSLGTAYSGSGEYQNSINCFRKADSILKSNSDYDPLRRAGLNINIGGILIRMNAPEKALSYFRAAGELARLKGVSGTIIQISSNEGMAGCYALLGKSDSAMRKIECCLDLFKLTGLNMKHDSSRMYLKMGDILSRKNEWKKSIEYYQKALATLCPDTINRKFDETGMKMFEADLLDLYKIYGHLGNSQLRYAIQANYDTLSLSRSYSMFVSALKISNHVSQDFGQGTSRMIFQESTKSILLGIMESGFLLREKQGNGSFNDLFTLADENTHRILLEDMEENRYLSTSGIPDSILKKIKGLKDDIVSCSRRYFTDDPFSGPVSFSSPDDLQSKLLDLHMKLDTLRKNIHQTYPLSALLKNKDKITEPSAIINRLKKDEAMLEYLYSDSLIYLFLIRSDGLSMKRIVLPSSFKITLHECLHQLKGAGVRNFPSLSQTLYSYLIAPAEPALVGIYRLIIVPDEELSLFPFETLIREDSGHSSESIPGSWHYLLKDFEIIYHFSAKAWFNDTLNGSLLSSSNSFAGFAPGFRNMGNLPESYSSLPNSLKEVSSISGLFGLEHRDHAAFLDTSATEINFRSHVSGCSHIHIATHSFISDRDPMSSALVFYASNHAEGPQGMNDGLLHLDEIGNLRLGASLVVLSACATGKGKVTHTEGVLAFSRGFFLAGASNVVYSLWNIPDHITSNLMISFYHSYFSGKTYSVSLREVKLQMISNPETALPYMWAGFVLLGK